MKASFDITAHDYDEVFTNTTIGRLQRERVWYYLRQHFPKGKSLKILELNCGTGEDAIYLSEMGHHVVATDISNQMLRVAKGKAQRQSKNSSIKFLEMDINKIHNFIQTDSFDLIFSNFGGLNCIPPNGIENLAKTSQKLLKSGGRFVAVVMPDFNWIESLYFIKKLKFSEISRRKSSNSVLVNVNGNAVKTWYYAPSKFAKIFDPYFSNNKTTAIGFLPSYLENAVNKKPLLRNLDNWLLKRKLVKGSDHFLIDLQKRND